MTREEFNKIDHLSLTFNYRSMISHENNKDCDFNVTYTNGIISTKVYSIYNIDSYYLIIDSIQHSNEKRKTIRISNFINLVNEGYIKLIYGPSDIRNFKLIELIQC